MDSPFLFRRQNNEEGRIRTPALWLYRNKARTLLLLCNMVEERTSQAQCKRNEPDSFLPGSATGRSPLGHGGGNYTVSTEGSTGFSHVSV
jgi:hypothetical protein